MSENLDDTTPTSKEEWCEYFLARPEHVMNATLDNPNAQGEKYFGVRMAQQAREDRKASREEDRHGESMLASAHANRRANQALSVGVGALILALVAILQQCRG
jgi:hypothetical protein